MGSNTSNSYPIYNLIPAEYSNIESSGWSVGTYSSDYQYVGSNSLKLTGTTSIVEITSQLSIPIFQINGHIYYSRIYEYHTNSALNNTARFQLYWPIAEPVCGTALYGVENKWNMCSIRFSRNDWNTAQQELRIDFDNLSIDGSVYYDAVMLIDLTADFGPGQEPSKEWCDKNIPYFTGTINMRIPDSKYDITCGSINLLENKRLGLVYDRALAHHVDGRERAEDSYCVTGLIPLVPGCTNVTINAGGTNSSDDILFEYDEAYHYVSYWNMGSNPRTFNLDGGTNTKYVRATFVTENLVNCYIYDNTNQIYICRPVDGVLVDYKGNTIALLTSTESKTLSCQNKYMESNLIIGDRTLLCKDQIMPSNVTVSNTLIDTPTLVSTPTQKGNIYYNGSSQSPSWNNYSSTTMSVTGTTSASNAGMYNANFTAKDGYVFTDGYTYKTASWSIQKSTATCSLSSSSGSISATSNSTSFTVSSNSTGSVVATSSDTSKATVSVSGSTVTLNRATQGSGNVTITVYVNGDSNTTQSNNATYSLSIATYCYVTVPSQSGSLTYNGSTLYPSWSNYDTSKMSISGTTSGVNAGTYSAVFSLTDSYWKWSDGSTGSKTVSWTIGKASCSVSASPSSKTFDSSTNSATFTITSSSGGQINDASYTNTTTAATASMSFSYSGMSLTATVSARPTVLSSNDGYITVTCAATDNYYSGSCRINVTINKSSCVTGDTLIMMADGTQKPIRDVKLGDQIMTWSLVKGQFEAQPVNVVYEEGTLEKATVIRLTFKNDVIVDTVYEHGFFDKTINNYYFINVLNYKGIIGHECVQYNSDGTYEFVEVVNSEIIEPYNTDMWSLQTAYNENFITNGILSITQEYKHNRYNYFDIDENMKWNSETQKNDIETYGVFDYDDWKEVISEEDFYAFNGPWFKVLIGKGYITLEDIPNMIAETPSLVED